MKIKLVDQLNEHFRTVIVPKYPKLFKKEEEKIGMFCEERHMLGRKISFSPTEREVKIGLYNFWHLFGINFKKENNNIYLCLFFKDFEANKQVSEFPLSAEYYIKTMVIRKPIGTKEYEQIEELSSNYSERIDTLFPGALGFRHITKRCYQYFVEHGMLAYIDFICSEIEKDLPKNNHWYILESLDSDLTIDERYFQEAEQQVIENQRVESERSKEEERQMILELYLKPEKHPGHND